MATIDYDNVIELDPCDFEEDEDMVYAVKKKQSILAAIWFRLTRMVRRALSGSKRAFRRLWMKIPRFWQFVIKFSATVVGWFAAYMLFYITLIVAFYYSIVLGFAVIALWAGLFAWYIYDPNDSSLGFA